MEKLLFDRSQLLLLGQSNSGRLDLIQAIVNLGSAGLLFFIEHRLVLIKRALRLDGEIGRVGIITGQFLLDLNPIDAFHAASQAEIANLNRAVVVNENVAWLQISVDNLSFVQVAEAAQNIIHD